jgi:hypothetical protein
MARSCQVAPSSRSAPPDEDRGGFQIRFSRWKYLDFPARFARVFQAATLYQGEQLHHHEFFSELIGRDLERSGFSERAK